MNTIAMNWQPKDRPGCRNGIIMPAEAQKGHTKCQRCRETDAAYDQRQAQIETMHKANRVMK